MPIIRAMDELLIEDKKYVSSKRAAKITGYAKDYIGQLCREGRVPARFVGRSWYVLETAIQDHRFGTADVQFEKSVETYPEPIISPKWEPPRYESSQDELLPSINRLRVDTSENSEELTDSERLQDTWKTWFDRIADSETVPTTEKVETDTEAKVEIIEKIYEEKPVDVPIHAVYRQPPEELLPRSIHLEVRPSIPEIVSNVSTRGIMAVQVFSITIAFVTATLAVVGTGYLDEYIISNNQVRVIAGVGLYNK